MVHRNRLMGAATVLLGITLFFWVLVLSSVLGFTNFLRGGMLGLLPAALVIVMIVLPIIAVVLASMSRRKDDQTLIS
ncbi:MAG: hypothetical protein IPH59_00745 [bacterium]|nr:hypothetical protein [bacterium]